MGIGILHSASPLAPHRTTGEVTRTANDRIITIVNKDVVFCHCDGGLRRGGGGGG